MENADQARRIAWRGGEMGRCGAGAPRPATVRGQANAARKIAQ